MNNSNEKLFVVSATPHIRDNSTIETVMRDVLIALTPAAIASVVFFGIRALFIITLSIVTCVATEYLFCKIVKKKNTVSDLSCIITGLLLAFNLSAYVSWWIPIVGGVFAILVCKLLFGGLGQNFINPALGARAFLLISYPIEMTRWAPVDTVSAPTPLAQLQETAPEAINYIQALIGTTSGCIGETSAILLLLGGIYLLIRKVITWHVPLSFLGTVFILSELFSMNSIAVTYPLYELLVGGVLLGAFFMATDYSSSPVTPKGKIIMGLGCGLLTVIIRHFGGYPEGVSFSILLMNLCVPIIERYTRPKVFGVGGAC